VEVQLEQWMFLLLRQQRPGDVSFEAVTAGDELTGAGTVGGELLGAGTVGGGLFGAGTTGGGLFGGGTTGGGLFGSEIKTTRTSSIRGPQVTPAKVEPNSKTVSELEAIKLYSTSVHFEVPSNDYSGGSASLYISTSRGYYITWMNI
jgi:hypothetical protein